MSREATKCVQCGSPAAYRFCGNGCFVAWAKKRTGVDCAVCRYNPETGRIGNSSTTRICPECRKDSANAGWVCGDDELLDEPALEAVHWKRGDTLGSLQDRPARQRTQLAERIIAAVFGSKPVYERRRVPRTDRPGRYRWAYRRATTRRAIARALKCDERYVRRVLAEYTAGVRVQCSENRQRFEPTSARGSSVGGDGV